MSQDSACSDVSTYLGRFPDYTHFFVSRHDWSRGRIFRGFLCAATIDDYFLFISDALSLLFFLLDKAFEASIASTSDSFRFLLFR